jgi:Flp pilus assembly CpaF family ATPase
MIIQISRMRDGKRRITQVPESTGTGGEKIAQPARAIAARRRQSHNRREP